MAIIDCPECKNKISDAASSCPQCGYPVIKERIKGRQIASLQKAGILIVITGIIFALLAKNWGWIIICPVGILLLGFSKILMGRIMK